MKNANVELSERDWEVLGKDQQIWREIEGRIIIIREFKREVPNEGGSQGPTKALGD